MCGSSPLFPNIQRSEPVSWNDVNMNSNICDEVDRSDVLERKDTRLTEERHLVRFMRTISAKSVLLGAIWELSSYNWTEEELKERDRLSFGITFPVIVGALLISHSLCGFYFDCIRVKLYKTSLIFISDLSPFRKIKVLLYRFLDFSLICKRNTHFTVSYFNIKINTGYNSIILSRIPKITSLVILTFCYVVPRELFPFWTDIFSFEA